MDKEFILSEIQRTAENGKALGKARYFNETGIKESDWYGKYWTKWSDAVKEAGITPNEKQKPLPNEYLLKKLADLTQELDKFPTAGDLKMKSRNDSNFPSHNTFSKFGNKSNLAQALLNYAYENNLQKIIPFCQNEIKNEEDFSIIDTSEPDEFGSVYLYKAGGNYKIGRTNNMKRRNREIQLQLPYEAELIHRITTDDPIGIEKYWHDRFSEKRLNGEWFKLNSKDVKAFRRRKFM